MKICIINYIKHFTHKYFIIDYFQLTGHEENKKHESCDVYLEDAEVNIAQVKLRYLQ